MNIAARFRRQRSYSHSMTPLLHLGTRIVPSVRMGRAAPIIVWCTSLYHGDNSAVGDGLLSRFKLKKRSKIRKRFSSLAFSLSLLNCYN